MTALEKAALSIPWARTIASTSVWVNIDSVMSCRAMVSMPDRYNTLPVVGLPAGQHDLHAVVTVVGE